MGSTVHAQLGTDFQPNFFQFDDKMYTACPHNSEMEGLRELSDVLN
jgi:hypothetical protein